MDDGYTARNLRRPGMQKALKLLRKGDAAALVVAKLDRLSRSMQDFADLLHKTARQRWALVALDFNLDMTTPNGRLVASILAAVAQWEREVIGARTRDAIAEARAAGATFGRQRMTPPDVVNRILTARAAGESFSAIARCLDAEAVPTPKAERGGTPQLLPVFTTQPPRRQSMRDEDVATLERMIDVLRRMRARRCEPKNNTNPRYHALSLVISSMLRTIDDLQKEFPDSGRSN